MVKQRVAQDEQRASQVSRALPGVGLAAACHSSLHVISRPQSLFPRSHACLDALCNFRNSPMLVFRAASRFALLVRCAAVRFALQSDS